ncbi:transcriptional regulator [Enterobacteriaceae bacterium LUAb1]
MLSEEKSSLLLEIETLQFEDIFSVDCFLNILTFHKKPITISLNEAQKRLLICLVNKINDKRDIISVVWQENHNRIRDNNYHQLVFQIRALLQRHGLPANLIITVPYYGLKLNDPLLRSFIKREATAESVLTQKPATDIKDNLQKSASSVKRNNKKNFVPRLLSIARSFF